MALGRRKLGQMAGSAAVAFLLAQGLTGEGEAMGNGTAKEAPVTLTCRATGPKVHLNEDLCPLLAGRLAAAGIAAQIVPDATAADLVLEVEDADAQGMTARLVWRGATPGPLLGTAVRDTTLGPAQLTPYFDGLIRQSPRP